MKAKELIAHLSENPEGEVYFCNLEETGTSWLSVDWVESQEVSSSTLRHSSIKAGDFVIGCDDE